MTTLEGIQDGEVLKSITGKLSAVYDSETRNGEYGEYTSQNCELTLADGKKYKLSLMNHVVPKSAKGKTITLSSVMVEKKGYQGVQYVKETYTAKKGKDAGKEVTKEVIKANAKATLEYPDGAPAETAAPTTSGVAGSQQPKPNRRLEQVTELDQPESYTQLVEQVGKLHYECNAVVRSLYAEDKLDEETMRSIVATVFIESNKHGGMSFLKFRKGDAAPETKKEDDAPWTEEKDEQDPEFNSTVGGSSGSSESEEVPEEVPAEEETAPENPYKDWENAKIPSGPKEGKTLAEVGKVTITKYYEAYAKTGFKTDFQKFVLQAAKDLNIHKDEEEDSIPY